VDAEEVREIGRQAKAGDSFQVGAAEWACEEGAAAMRFMEQGHAFAQGQFKRPFEQPPIFVEGEDVAACLANDSDGFICECMVVVCLECGEA
jgi:hypothetical protein